MANIGAKMVTHDQRHTQKKSRKLSMVSGIVEILTK